MITTIATWGVAIVMSAVYTHSDMQVFRGAKDVLKVVFFMAAVISILAAVFVTLGSVMGL